MNLIKTLFLFTFILFSSITYAGTNAQGAPNVNKIRADWVAVADAIELNGHKKAAADIRAAVEAMTDEELYLGYNLDVTGLTEAFKNTATASDAVNKRYSAYLFKPSARSAGLPGAVGYPGGICPISPERSNADDLLIAVDAIKIADLALEVAQGVWSVAERGCGTVAVAIGAVGNPQNSLCIITDTALFVANAVVTAAQATVDHIAFCDGAVDSAEIEGVYERTGHVHGDLTTHSANLVTHDANIDADLVAHNTKLIAHDANIDADLVAHNTKLVAHDANIDADLVAHNTNLVAHDANIDADLVAHNTNLIAHDANIDADLILHDTDIKALLANLQGAVNENQRLIKITMSRQQEILRLLMTPDGVRVVNEDVLTCTGADCPVYPALQLCSNGSLKWNCKK